MSPVGPPLFLIAKVVRRLDSKDRSPLSNI